MKSDRRIKTEKTPTKVKAAKRVRQATLKTNGKHPLASYEHIPIGIVECSLDGKYMDVNEEFCRITGYPRSALLRRGIKDLTHEEDYTLDIKLHEDLVAGKIPFYRLEKRFVRKDGDSIWVELTRSLVCDAEGKPMHTIGVVLDISDRKDVEKVLRESVERLRLATSTAQMFMWEWDFQSQSYTLDDNFEKVLGFSAGLLPRNDFGTIWALSTREDVQRISEEFQQAVENQRDLHALPCRVINPENGQIVWLEVNAKIVYNDLGNPERMFGVAQNITEGKRTEQALTEFGRQQEALYQLADQLHRTDSLADVFNAALDAVLRALHCNRAAILLFDDTGVMRFVAWRGLSEDYRKATEGHSPWKPGETDPEPVCVNDIDTAELSDSLKSILKREGIGSLAFIPLVSNGRLIGKFMVYFNTPHVFSVSELGLGLTIAHQFAFGIERKRAEEALRESEEGFRTLANAMPSMVWTAAPDGTITYANDQWFRYAGITPEENARGWPELVLHPDDYERCIREWTRALETVPDEYRIEVRNRRYDGQYHWFQTRAVPARDASGKALAWYGVTTDIHERTEAENRLALLAEISEMLRNYEDPYELMYTISKAVGEHLHVKRVLFNEIDLEHDREIVHRDYHNGVDSVAGVHKVSDYSSITSAEVASGRTVVNADSKTDPRTAQDYEKIYAISRERAYVVVPMMRDNRWVASLWVSDDAPRQWSSEEISLLEAIAERTWTVIEKLRIAQELHAKEAELEAIITQTPFMLTRCTRDLHYRFVSRAYAELIGRTPEEVAGKPIVEILGEEGLRRISPYIEQVLKGNQVEYESEVSFRGSKSPFLHVVYTPDRDEEGNVIGWFASIVDISERKHTEEALQQSEERFTLFMQHLPGLAWIKDVQGRYVYANTAAEKAFGTPREKLYGKTDEEVFTPKTAAQFKKNDERALRGGEGVQVVELLAHEDGVLHHSLVTKFPMPGVDGNTGLIGGTAFDITERLQAEEALRESEERFSAILRQATAGIVRRDVEGKMVFVNQAFCNMLGYTEAELLGKTIWEFMFEEDARENKKRYERLMMEGIPFNLERRLIREDGSEIWVDASVSPIMDAEGKPQSTVTVEVDITARKRAEEALQQFNLQLEDTVLRRTAKLRAVNQTLREEIAERKRVEEALRQSEAAARTSEEKLRTLFDLLPVGISFLSPKGQIVQMNSALSVILKLPKEQLLTQSYKSRNYIRADGTPMPPTEFASARALREGTTVYNVETGIVLENGEVVWTSVSAAPVDVADVGAVVVTVDITDSKRAERALQESYKRLRILSQRLVEVQEDERRALARELHDRVGQTLAALNINLIIVNSQLTPEASQQIGPRLNDSMKLVAETIALVRDVMTDLRPSVLDDYGLEAAFESHLAQFVSRYPIKTKFEKPDPPLPRLGPSLEMTFLRIAQEALMNIARHAQADQVNLSLRQAEDNVYLTIQDNGIGIASRQEASRPGSHGLNIMRERAAAFDGDLKVRSMPGRGTTIEVSIPFNKRAGDTEAREEKDV